MICYSKQPAFHPDWAWLTPEGFRDEPFILNFLFSNLVADGITRYEGLPVQADDDAEFHVRLVLIPQLGIFPVGFVADSSEHNPALVRISTSGGQQLSRDLILASGDWCGSGWSGTAAAGVSVVDPLVIPPGGVITVDLLLSTTAQPAFDSAVFGDASLLLYANLFGTGGNGYTLSLVDPAAANSPLTLLAGGTAASIGLATDGGGAIISTVEEVAAFINVNLAPYFVAETFGDGGTVVAADSLLLANGAADSPVNVAGAFVGVKRYRQC